MSDEAVAGYARLEEVERRLRAACARRQLSDATLGTRLGLAAEAVWDIDQGDELYLLALARRIAAAGGRLRLSAAFDDEEVVLLSEPAADAGG